MRALTMLSDESIDASAGSAPASMRNLKPAQPEDAVIFYYAGHGTAEQSRFYLIPHDLGYNGAQGDLDESSVQTILQHSISDLELEQALERVDAGQLLLVIDACNSGQALEAEEKRRGPMNSKGLAELAYEKGMDILTAAQSYQAALEAVQLGHGYLTYALVEEGLKTAAADIAPKDGQVEIREWLDYATSRVPQLQQTKVIESRAAGREVFFVAERARGDRADSDELQRPRAFYRREVQSQPFIVADHTPELSSKSILIACDDSGARTRVECQSLPDLGIGQFGIRNFDVPTNTWDVHFRHAAAELDPGLRVLCYEQRVARDVDRRLSGDRTPLSEDLFFTPTRRGAVNRGSNPYRGAILSFSLSGFTSSATTAAPRKFNDPFGNYFPAQPAGADYPARFTAF